MLWENLLGHEKQRQWFQHALKQNRMASTFLFVGPPGIGKRSFAELLAKTLLCRRTVPQDMQPCGSCEDCAQCDAYTHPDLLIVRKPDDKATIPVDLLIGPPEARMREGLCHDLHLRPYYGRRKIAILDDADALAVEGANSLLKTLEEPPQGSVLILISTSEQRQLPTIRSRSQIVRFQALSVAECSQLLLRHQICDNPADAEAVARASSGSMALAAQLVDKSLLDFRENLYKHLAQRPMPFQEIAKEIGSITEQAGKDGASKRERLRLIFDMASQFFRGMIMLYNGTAITGDPILINYATDAARYSPAGVAGALSAWERCVQASEEVDRNVNQTALLECWSADVARDLLA